jgi:murein L,D-transpeptidase YcbB/YkuD
MNKSVVTRGLIFFFIIVLSVAFFNCKKEESTSVSLQKQQVTFVFDSAAVAPFFTKFPKLKVYQKQVVEIYQKQRYNYLWFDKQGKKEITDALYSRINNIGKEGIQTSVPYKTIFDDLYQSHSEKPNLEMELFLTTYFFYYTNKVIQGIDVTKVKELEWYLPRKKLSYVDYLDSLLVNPKGLGSKEPLVAQYYKFKEVLQKYRAIEKKGGWKTIETSPDFKSLKPGDSSSVIGKIRTRLFSTFDIAYDSKSLLYDEELRLGIVKYKKRNGFELDAFILPKHITAMNVSINERIKTLLVNMERCRWISTDIVNAKEFVVINIPSYKLSYFKDKEVVLSSNVVVGTAMNKTVIFSGNMMYVVFSPYWNVPTSILKKEILPGIKKDRKYLAKHNMEWSKGMVRQKPGLDNSLGLVKFLFPNNNNIYLHDSPSKNLFSAEKRALSHGCIRVEKAKELANAILVNDTNWSPEKIDEAMNKGKESWYILKHKIPVYIGYFTAWVDNEGTINFYKDIYDRDIRLEEMLLEE